ncbi:MAG: hypothetical protein B7Y39_10960 [Bdellovibrio sp. 28-41-41]|nr:MAG: hypothetical protein B7Y39_10960 [Bdellovibrio sp. 28-41-41]
MIQTKSVYQLNDFEFRNIVATHPIKSSVCVANGLNDRSVIDEINKKQITAVIQNSLFPLEEKLRLLKKLNVLNIYNTDISLIGGQIKSTKFNTKSDREEVLDELFDEAHVDLTKVKNNDIFSVSQELMMNAQIDAPTLAIQMLQKESQIIFEKNDLHNLFAISVIDNFGSLVPKTMLSQMKFVFEMGFAGGMSQKKEGAGLGSSLIFNACDTMLIAVKPNLKTRVSVILPYQIPQKKIEQIQKSVIILGE